MVAQKQLEIAQIRLAGIDADRNSTRAEVAAQAKEVELAQIELDRIGTEISPLLTGDSERAQYAVEKLQQTIAESQIIAPFDGLLLSLTLTPGQSVTAYAPVATLADPNQLEISANILSDQLQLLAEGMPVTMEMASRPGQKLTGAHPPPSVPLRQRRQRPDVGREGQEHACVGRRYGRGGRLRPGRPG